MTTFEKLSNLKTLIQKNYGKKDSIARYNLIINKLRRKPCIFNEISDYLERESEMQDADFTISKRTFRRDVDDILSIFKIDIQFDYKAQVWKIDSDDFQEMNSRILEAFDTFNALNLTDRLSKHIHFEKRKPQGTEHLYGILHAIKNQIQIKFVYQKYWEEGNDTHRTVNPLALKEFKNCWYLIAEDSKDSKRKTFALDRISELEIGKKIFSYPKDFDVNIYFKNCFGIMAPNATKPTEVILSFDAHQGKYIKSMPLHETQEIISETEDELQIKLTVYLTHDFVMELLSHGESVEVLKLKKLQNQLAHIAQSVAGYYLQ